MQRRLTFLGLLAVAALAACGGSTSTTGPTLDPTLVEGLYEPTALSFDPQGYLPAVSLLDSISQQIQPQMSVGNDGRFAFLFFNSQSRLPQLAHGSYRMLEDGIRLDFDQASDAETLLLPQQLDLTFDQNAGTLSFTGSIQTPRARLFQLVPDWQNEPLTDPVPGVLTVEFTMVPSQ
jgi:hypothetical protein